MLRPLPGRRPLDGLPAGSFADAPVVVAGPPGAYLAEALASTVERRGAWSHCVWVRPETAQGAAVRQLLAAACRLRWPDGGTAPAGGPSLGAALRPAPVGAVLVVELPGGAASNLRFVAQCLWPTVVDRGVTLVLVSEGRARRRRWTRDGSTAFVALDGAAGLGAAAEGSALPAEVVARLARMAGAHAAVAADVVDAAAVWPVDAVVCAIAGARRWRQVLDQITCRLLEHADSDQREALAVAVATGYWHPQLCAAGTRVADLRPWLVPLEQQWGWLRPIWRRTLARQLAGRAASVAVPSRTIGSSRPERHAATRTPTTLDVRMLGELEVRIDGVAVPTAPAHRGFAVLRYVLSRDHRAATRDELLEVFWPDVDPRVARNRLQVAVSSVRRSLRTVTQAPVLEHRNGAYGISPKILVDTDVARFDAALAAAGTAERHGRPAAAEASLRTAVELYRGDLAADAPYEQWTLLSREHLRLRYLDALDCMSRVQLAAGHVEDCIVTANRMLTVDPCREDAHRLLMRCYADQGRAYQALRQFELCRRALEATLDVPPSRATVELRDTIQGGAAVVHARAIRR